MNQALKPNDMFVATISNLGATTLDLVANNINFDNTQFLSKEEYKNTPFVQKAFTKDNVFDEAAFEKVYDAAAEKYQELSDKKSYDSLEDFIEYDPFSAAAPLGSKKRSPFVSYEKLINPMRQKIGIEDFNQVSAPEKSLKELAQSHKIWNPETESWEENSAESLSFFDKVLGHSLSYAKYEQTGEQVNPVTGELGFHEAGEWILDENGEVFTQYTPKTDLLHTEVVALSDILTKEDSALNSIDVFDSDDLHKSTTGIVMKNLLKIIPYIIPQTRAIWGAVLAAYGTMAALPIVYKQIDALVSNDNDSNAYIAASGMEHWFKKFEGSTTDESKQSFFSLENSLSMISDIFGQIHQQKAAAKLGKTLGKLGGLDLNKVEDVEKVTKLGLQLSLGYMALTGTADVYNTALQSGFDNRTAAVAGLLSAGALFGIMNLNATTRGVGTWFLGPEDGVDTRPMIATTKIVKELFKDIEEALANGGIKSVQKTFKQRLYSTLDDLARGTGSILKSGTNELLEETSEEIVQDAVKGIIDGASALGLTGSNGRFGVVEDVFSMSGLQRYITTALGGFVGGSMFHLQQNYLDPLTNKWFGYKGDPTKTISEQLEQYNLITAMLEGRTDDIMAEIDRLYKFIPLGKFTGLTDKNGNAIEFIGKADLTQADIITNIAKRQVQEVYQNIKSVLGEANLTEKRLFDINAEHLNQLKLFNFLSDDNKAIFTKYLNAKNASLLSQVVSLKEKYDAIKDKDDQPDALKKEVKKEYEDALEILKNHFSSEGFVNDIIEGHMITNARFASMMNPFLSEENFYKTFYEETDEFEKKSYKDLTKEEKEIINNRWKIAKEFEGDTVEKMLVQVPTLRHMYLTAQERFSKPISEWLSIEKRSELFQALKDLFAQTSDIYSKVAILKNMGLKDESLKLFNSAFTVKNLDKFLDSDNSSVDLLGLKHNYDLAEELIKSNLLTFSTNLNRDEDGNIIGGLNKSINGFNVLKQVINHIARISNVQRWNKDTLQELVRKVNDALNDPNSNYIVSSALQEDENGNAEINKDDLINLNILLVENEENINKFIEENQILKTKAFLDLLTKNESQSITEDEYNYIVDQLAAIIGANINKNFNALDLLKDWVITLFEYDPLKRDEYINIINKVKEKKVQKNPFKQLFDFIHFDLYNSNNNILDIMFNWNQDLKGLDLDSNVKEKIQLAINTINFMKNIINGMYVNENGMGINSALLNYIEKNKDTSKKKEDFATIDTDDYNLLNMYLDDIQMRLLNFAQLSDEMSKSKSEEFKKIREITYKGLINGYENFENEIINNIISKVTREDDDDDETYLYKIRTALYTNRNLIFAEIENIVDKLDIKNLKSHYSLKEAMLKNDNIRILILDLLASISVDPKEFLEKSKTVYSKETFDPRYDQEFIMHGAYAWVKAMQENKDAKKAYGTYLKKIESIFTDESGKQHKIMLENALSIYGAAGSGKTAVAAIISKMLDSEVFVTSTQTKKVEDLRTALDLKEDRGKVLEDLLIEDLRNFIKTAEEKFSEWLSENNTKRSAEFKFKDGDFEIILTGDFEKKTLTNIRNIQITKNGAKLTAALILNLVTIPKVLIYNDEVQLNNVFYNYLLNQTGIPIIRIGAHDQVGHSFNYNTKKKKIEEGVEKEIDEPVSVEWDEANYASLIMPKLLGMYRADNSVMKQIVTALSSNLNMEHAGMILGNLDEEVIIRETENDSVKKKNNIIQFNYGLTLKGNKQFSGIKIDNTVNKGFIDEYLPKDKTVVITDAKTLPAELQDYETKTLKEALGSEWDYVIFYLPTVAGNTGAYTATKLMYSAVTRAKLGAYIINNPATKSSIFTKSGLKAESVEVSDVTAYTPVKQTDIDNRVQKIEEVLAKLKIYAPKKNVDEEIVDEESEIQEESENIELNIEEVQKEIESNTKEINEIEEKGDTKTEEELKKLEELKNKNNELKEALKKLGEHYDKLDSNWRIILTFYRRGGKGWEEILKIVENVSNVNELKNKIKKEKLNLDTYDEDFGAFISLVAKDIINVEPKPDPKMDNKIYWIGLFQQFILNNFDNAKEFYFWHKVYDESSDALLYKENNKYPKKQDDDLYLITFNFEGKRFTLGLIAYKTDSTDFIATSPITTLPIKIKLNELNEDKIAEYKKPEDEESISKICEKTKNNPIYRITGIRTFTRDNSIPIHSVAGGLLGLNIKAETLERYWLSGVKVDSSNLSKDNANLLRHENGQTVKKYEKASRNYYKYKRISLKFAGETKETAIRTETHLEKVNLNVKKDLLKRRYAVQLLDFFLNKKATVSKNLPSTKKGNFLEELTKCLANLKSIVDTYNGEYSDIVKNFYKAIEQKTSIDVGSQAVTKFLEVFNNKFKYYSFDYQNSKTIKSAGKELSDAVIEPPNLLIVPELVTDPGTTGEVISIEPKEEEKVKEETLSEKNDENLIEQIKNIITPYGWVLEDNIIKRKAKATNKPTAESLKNLFDICKNTEIKIDRRVKQMLMEFDTLINSEEYNCIFN